jgi:hypothetical protein
MSLEQLFSFNFGKLKKRKYELYINRECTYSFVTTIRDDEDAILHLEEKYKNNPYSNTTSVAIYKIQDDKKVLLKKDKIKAR